MATLEDEHTDAATHDIPDALTPSQRQSPGPMLHDVWRVLDGEGGGIVMMELVAEAVRVMNRGIAGKREAIALATANESENGQYGTFRVVKHGEMSDPIVREQVVEPRDKWS
jgi:hypothetical protein